MILEEYKPESREERQDVLKDVFGPMFKAMLQGEMDEHLGYETNDHGSKSTTKKTSYGEISVSVPRDREATFDPKVILKRTKEGMLRTYECLLLWTV